ncbi:MAG: tRNA (guanine-N7)-methyltransferase, partial [Bdellovibrionales bacterium]|nr:tRNA (guanine-N7)-methyltransferase [Bdellovibrionales bacterium]
MQNVSLRISRTRQLPSPNKYAVALLNENLNFNYDEERVSQFKGKWREEAFALPQNAPVDLEIGVGNGFHLAHYLETKKDRAIVGLELKYKPLIQT